MQKLRPWDTLDSKTVYDASPHFILNADKVRTNQGEVIEPFYRMATRDFVVVLPFLDEDKVILVQQFRNGIRSLSLEVPGGAIELGETALQAAHRELEEETGYRAAALRVLGGQASDNPSMMTNKYTVCLAQGVQRVGAQKLDASEELILKIVSFTEALDMAIQGKIVSSPTIVCLFRAAVALGQLAFAP